MTCKIIAHKQEIQISPRNSPPIRTIPPISFLGDPTVNSGLREAIKFLSTFFPGDMTLSNLTINTTQRDQKPIMTYAEEFIARYQKKVTLILHRWVSNIGSLRKVGMIRDAQQKMVDSLVKFYCQACQTEAYLLKDWPQSSYFMPRNGTIRIHPKHIGNVSVALHEFIHALQGLSFKGFTDRFLATTFQYLYAYFEQRDWGNVKETEAFKDGEKCFNQHTSGEFHGNKYSEEIRTQGVIENYQAGYFVAGILSAMDAKYSFEQIKHFLQLLADGNNIEEALGRVCQSEFK